MRKKSAGALWGCSVPRNSNSNAAQPATTKPRFDPTRCPIEAMEGTLNVNDYKVLAILAESNASIVYKVKLVKEPHTLFVLKKIKIEAAENEVRAQKEIDMLVKFKHPRVVHLVDYSMGNVTGDKEANLLLTYYPKAIPQLIYSGPGYPACSFEDRHVVVKILRQVAEALAYVHSQGFRHGDVRPGHVLLSEDYEAVLTDFESVHPLVKEINSAEDAASVADAMYEKDAYRAPEIYQPTIGSVIDGKADVWSFGCVIYYVLFSKSPFKEGEHGVAVENIMTAKYTLPAHNWPASYIETLSKCLTVNQAERLTVDELRARLDAWEAPPAAEPVAVAPAGTPDRLKSSDRKQSAERIKSTDNKAAATEAAPAAAAAAAPKAADKKDKCVIN